MSIISQMLGCRYPVIQGAMGVISNPELVSAVSEAGGLVTDLSGNGQTADLNGVGSTTLTADAGGYSGLAGEKGLSYASDDAAPGVNYAVATSRKI